MRRRNSLSAHAGPLADRAPALDADEPRDLRLLRQGVELLQRPRLLVRDQAIDDQLVAVLVDVGRLLFGIVGVERKRARDRALGIGLGQAVGIEQPRLHPVVELRHDAQRLLGGRPVDDVAAGEQGQRAEACRIAQKQAARGIGQQLCRVLDEEAGIDTASTRFGAWALFQRPRIMARRLLGTSNAITTCSTRNRTMATMAKKCTRRAPS